MTYYLFSSETATSNVRLEPARSSNYFELALRDNQSRLECTTFR